MMVKAKVVLGVLLAAMIGGDRAALAEELEEPPRQVREFVSASGRFALSVGAVERVIERGSGLRTNSRGQRERFSTSKVASLGAARLIEKTADRGDVVRWSATLADLPKNVLVADDGVHVVTFDTLDARRGAHKLVIYGAGGEPLAGYALADVLSEKEIAEHVRPKNKALAWEASAEVELDTEAQRVTATFAWGKALTFSLRTGKLVKDAE